MRKLCVRVLPALAVVLLAAPLVAQGPGGRGGMGPPNIAALVTNKGVIEELKLTDEQKEKLAKSTKEVTDKHADDLKSAGKDREKRAAIQKEMNAELSKVVESGLKPEQVKRLQQIEIWATLQTSGPAVFASEKVEKALNLTDAQKSNLKEVTETLTKARREVMQGAQGDMTKMQEAMATFRKTQTEALEKFQGTLSEAQKKAWKELAGEKFEYKPAGRRPVI